MSMRRRVRATTVLEPSCGLRAAEALALDPQLWLPATPLVERDRFALTVRAGRISRVVHAWVGPVRVEARKNDVVHTRPLSWQPQVRDEVRDRVLPSFTGAVELRLHTVGDPLLTVAGSYQPPGGSAGRGIDALLGHHVANHTIARLLDDIRPTLAGHPTRTPEVQDVHR